MRLQWGISEKKLFFLFLTTMGPWNSMFSQYFVILFRIFVDRLPSNFFLTQKRTLKRSSSPLLPSGVVNSFTEKQHTMHIWESENLSRFHQLSIASHQFKFYTVECFWKEWTTKKTMKKVFFRKLNLSSNIDSRALGRYFQRPGFLPQKPGKVARFRETSLNKRLSRTLISRRSFFFCLLYTSDAADE